MAQANESATLLKGGLIVDGSASPAQVGDVLLVGERIAAVGQVSEALIDAHRPQVIDCAGLVVAPGFIDVHTHDDAAAIEKADMLPKLSQGVTTVIVGNCGISLAPVVSDAPAAPLSLLGNTQFRHRTMREYADAVDATRPGVNVAALLGHTALRMRHMPVLDRAANAGERAAMAADMQEAMDAGALGLSSGI
ncbi:MAG: amidohydrolase family protein, partial [Proteobacteria bacterium]|nr:amidohydrolase family protein [Pseudomonadota bacterium]